MCWPWCVRSESGLSISFLANVETPCWKHLPSLTCTPLGHWPGPVSLLSHITLDNSQPLPSFLSSPGIVHQHLRAKTLRNGSSGGSLGCFPDWGTDIMCLLWSLWLKSLGLSWKSNCSKGILNLHIYIHYSNSLPVHKWAVQHPSPNLNLLPPWGLGRHATLGANWNSRLRTMLLFLQVSKLQGCFYSS